MDASERSDFHRTHDREATARSSSDGGSEIEAIVARSLRDRVHDHLNLMAHDHRMIVAIKPIS